uniref:Hydroxysteroid dehydrogenase-like protein 2 n=1 Tax=Syphacia muris TaxID=451379 RepID=A0A0N5ANP2_9BILA
MNCEKFNIFCSFSGKTVFISGASRGIGKAIALKLAEYGANIVVAAKTATKHPKLPGTIYTAVEEIKKAGGDGLACVMDIRSETDVENAVKKAVDHFGGIDVLINNASAISITGTLETSMKKFDLMHSINTRGTFMLSQKCIPYLKHSANPHILNLSPPLLMESKFFSHHVAYTMAKYGMSMCVLGMSEELKPYGIGVNALWPQTAIWTAAMESLGAAKDICRKPSIVADAAYLILSRSGKRFTGNFVTDEEVLKQEGVENFEKYSYNSGSKLLPDFFLPGVEFDDFFSPESGIRIPSSNSSEKLDHNVEHAQNSEKFAIDAGDVSDNDYGFDIKDEKMKSVFISVGDVLDERLVNRLNAVFQFKFRDDLILDLFAKTFFEAKVRIRLFYAAIYSNFFLEVETPFFFIDAKNGSGRIAPGISDEMDVAFEIDRPTFLSIFHGKLSPVKAFFNRDLRVRGDMAKALLLKDVVKKLYKR